MRHNREYRQPIFPEGFEVLVGVILAGLILAKLYFSNWPWWICLSAAVVTYIVIVYVFQIGTEADMFWVKSNNMLKTQINPSLQRLSSVVNHRGNLGEAIEIVTQVISDLKTKKSSVMFSGFQEIAMRLDQLEKTINGYQTLRKSPSKAGNRSSELLTQAEEAFDGFLVWAKDLNERVSQDQIMDMAVSARILRQLKLQ